MVPSVLGVAPLVGGGSSSDDERSTTQTCPDRLFPRREAVLREDGWMECRALHEREFLETILEAAAVVDGLRAGSPRLYVIGVFFFLRVAVVSVEVIEDHSLVAVCGACDFHLR